MDDFLKIFYQALKTDSGLLQAYLDTTSVQKGLYEDDVFEDNDDDAED